jgi:heme/copper-type cytochrome/quinol oxidase subunit 2
MRFDWVNILATVIFVSIVVTLILAVASYFAYKVREARRPKAGGEVREYRPSAAAASASAKADAAPVNAATKQ